MTKKKKEGVRGYNPPDLVESDTTHQAVTQKINRLEGTGEENDKMGDQRFK
jgi:hypothetical protein